MLWSKHPRKSRLFRKLSKSIRLKSTLFLLLNTITPSHSCLLKTNSKMIKIYNKNRFRRLWKSSISKSKPLPKTSRARNPAKMNKRYLQALLWTKIWLSARNPASTNNWHRNNKYLKTRSTKDLIRNLVLWTIHYRTNLRRNNFIRNSSTTSITKNLSPMNKTFPRPNLTSMTPENLLIRTSQVQKPVCKTIEKTTLQTWLAARIFPKSCKISWEFTLTKTKIVQSKLFNWERKFKRNTAVTSRKWWTRNEAQISKILTFRSRTTQCHIHSLQWFFLIKYRLIDSKTPLTTKTVSFMKVRV